MTEEGPLPGRRQAELARRQAEAALRQAEIALRQAESVQRRVETLARRDPFWPAQLTVLVAIALSLDLPSTLTIRQVWLIPTIEAVLFAALVMSTPWVPARQHRTRRKEALTLVGLVSASNLFNLGLLVHTLLKSGGVPASEVHQLILAGVEIWVTNVLLFAVLYWELDRGGPIARAKEVCPDPDFLFPQMSDERLGGLDWRARYIDYLYTSYTNASAFSPTDTMPLSPAAKMMMAVQSTASLVTVGMVFARAVNILT